jgi:C-terminal processing protease CtpA/Prc
MRDKCFFLFSFIIFYCESLKAQTYAYIEQDTIVKVHYQLSSEHRQLYNTDLVFPYNGLEKGVDIFLLKSINDKKYSIEKEGPININEKTRIEISEFYSMNVKGFEVIVHNANGYFSFVQSVDADGFHPSIKSKLLKKKEEKGNYNTSRIFFNIVRINENLPFHLTFSDLQIVDFNTQKIISPLPFFKKIFPYNNLNATKHLTPIFVNGSSKTNWFSMEFSQSPVMIQSDCTTINSNKLLYDILRRSIVEYPFYKEKGLKRKSILRKVDNIWKNDSLRNECELGQNFQQLIKSAFHDGHFNITLNCKSEPLLPGPLRLAYIKGNYQVAVNLDTLLDDQIPLGSIITKINNRSINFITDSLRKQFYPDEYYKRRKITVLNDLAKDLVSFKEGSKVLYEYLSPLGVKRQTQIVYQKKYYINSNLVNVHCEYKAINANVGYFKINNFDNLPTLRFQTVIDSIQNKDLIIDLRGNGGGDMYYLDDFLSFFINKSSICLLKGISRDGQKIDSLYFTNYNKRRISSSVKIAILVDSKTACSSEVFINVLRQNRENVIVVGTDNTWGALANAYKVILPSKKVGLTINSPSLYKYFFDEQIEDIGIQPDFSVTIDNVLELKPYEDKVLQTAIQKLQPKI